MLGYEEKHKLNLHTDIVAIITDGASVMKKVGRIINIDQQLGFAHGLQLGVIERLLKIPSLFVILHQVPPDNIHY